MAGQIARLLLINGITYNRYRRIGRKMNWLHKPTWRSSLLALETMEEANTLFITVMAPTSEEC